jgi:hypothetical protein
MYDCIRCLKETDNDCDICEDCLTEVKNEDMYLAFRDRIEQLEKALRAIIVHCEIPEPPNAEALKLFARAALMEKKDG